MYSGTTLVALATLIGLALPHTTTNDHIELRTTVQGAPQVDGSSVRLQLVVQGVDGLPRSAVHDLAWTRGFGVQGIFPGGAVYVTEGQEVVLEGLCEEIRDGRETAVIYAKDGYDVKAERARAESPEKRALKLQRLQPPVRDWIDCGT